MISMVPKDRNVLRFLWLKDVFQVFDISPSPFLLNAIIKHHLDKYLVSHPELVQILTLLIYVNVVFGADSEEEAYTLHVK